MIKEKLNFCHMSTENASDLPSQNTKCGLTVQCWINSHQKTGHLWTSKGSQFFYNFTFFILCNFISSPPLINGLRISKIWQILKCFILGHFIINKNLLFLKSVQYYSYNISTDVIDDFPNKDFTFWGRHRWNAENGHGCAFN